MSVTRIAITRRVSSNIHQCELTHRDREPIDLARAEQQHAQYVAALVRLGCDVQELPAEPALPDSVFVEDTAVVLDHLAIIARPGAMSRRPETESIAAVLARHRTLVRITDPATLDGGDVLVVGRDVYIGLSTRTTIGGVDQMREALSPLGYRVVPVTVAGCLHLKSAVGRVGHDVLLLNPALVDARQFAAAAILEVDPTEPNAGCALWIGDTVLFPTEHSRTATRLHAAGIRTLLVEMSELAKAEAGITCCSLVFDGSPSGVVR